MTIDSSGIAFREIEKDPALSVATRFFRQSFYVSIKDAHCHMSFPAVNSPPVNYRGLLSLLFWSVLALIRRSAAETIFFSADVGVSMRSDGTIEDQFAVFPDGEKPWHCLAVGSLRGLPSPRELYKAGIVSENILLLPLVLLLRPVIKIVMQFVAKKKVVDLCSLFGRYGLVVRPEWVVGVVSRDCARYLVYKALIKFSGARKVYLVSACGRSFIVNAARSLGAIVVEIQHGVCGPNHRGFNYQCPHEAIAAPDFLVATNDYWRNEALRAGFFTAAQVSVATPSGNSCQYCFSGDEPEQLADARGKKYILFTGQPPVVDQISAQIEAAYPLLVNRDIYFVYKLHPADSVQVIAELKQRWANHDRIILINQPVCIKCLLRHSAAHASFWSTCHHDAVEMLDRTFVLTMPGIHHMDEYCTSLPSKFVPVNHLLEIISIISKEESA